MNTKLISQTLIDEGTHIGFQILGAIVLWIVGRWLIGFTVRIVNRGMMRQKVDATLASYAISTISGLLNVILIISILGAFGVQTATFAALFAAFGLAIGAAWGGLLSNFAAGVFMVVLRPFKVGDLVEAGDVLGTVMEIGPFVTKINTLDNVLTIVGNNKIFSDNIQNFSHNPYRRVDLFMQLNHDANVGEVMTLLKTRLAQIANVLSEPSPVVEILEFNLNGPKLAVRPFCNNADYWQVYFDTNRTIRELGTERGYSAPEQHLVIRTNAELNGDPAQAVVGTSSTVATHTS
jgi:small conductance mechanosensitive channel